MGQTSRDETANVAVVVDRGARNAESRRQHGSTWCERTTTTTTSATAAAMWRVAVWVAGAARIERRPPLEGRLPPPESHADHDGRMRRAEARDGRGRGGPGPNRRPRNSTDPFRGLATRRDASPPPPPKKGEHPDCARPDRESGLLRSRCTSRDAFRARGCSDCRVRGGSGTLCPFKRAHSSKVVRKNSVPI